MIKIAVIGIAGRSVFLSVDEFNKIGETAVANSFHSELGGKGFNQALAASRYGAKVSFLSAAYQGDVDEFNKTTKDCEIVPFYIPKEESSPYAVITTDKNGDNKVIVYRGAELEEKDVELFSGEIKTSDILLINNEVPVEVNERAVKIAKENGVKVILNPAPYRKNPVEFLDKIDLFTPNEYEIFGLDDYQNVIVTLGKKGCLIKKTNEIISAAKIQKVVDTTGAGDTFNGVLACCIAEGEELNIACKKANIASAIKVQRKNIFNSIPNREEIENFKE